MTWFRNLWERWTDWLIKEQNKPVYGTDLYGDGVKYQNGKVTYIKETK